MLKEDAGFVGREESPSPSGQRAVAESNVTSPVPSVTQSRAKVSPGKRKLTPLQIQQRIRERRNWHIHQLFIRQEYMDCLAVIEKQLVECEGVCEYALYAKGLILRSNGELMESLGLFQAAAMLNPGNRDNLKQVGRSLHLLGNHLLAIDAFNEMQRSGVDDWDVHHTVGLCHVYLGNDEEAEKSFFKANAMQKHDATYLQLGKLFTRQKRYNEALRVYLQALEASPENPELLTEFGLVSLKNGDVWEAFHHFGSSLAIDPRNVASILAAGSIIQDNGDFDVALCKYRVAVKQIPNSAQLWSNIGVCFLGKANLIAAIACLRKAVQLAPFDWIVPFNLGCVFLTAGQYASAFHYFSASISLKKDYALSYMYVGISLSMMNDTDNAANAYKKALSLDSADYLILINYAIFLYCQGKTEEAASVFGTFNVVMDSLDEPTRKGCSREILRARKLLSDALLSTVAASPPHISTALPP